MTTQSFLTAPSQVGGPAQPDPERGHRSRVYLAAAASAALLLTLTLYGLNYYWLPISERPYSPKHHLLRPSGAIGVNLGILGFILFLLIFLYALRKRIPFLSGRGNTRHWMDFHIVAGVTAPFVIAFHASFKFRGLAGIAFWIMLAVALSGIIGRYLYSQIPRSLNAAELSLQEVHESEANLTSSLVHQTLFSATQLDRVFRMPSTPRVQAMSPPVAIVMMIGLDLARPWKIAGLRLSAVGFAGALLSFGGLRRTRNAEVERIVQLARFKASLAKRIVFLGHTHRVFHLWHVIHRPFSYAFAVLALIHIVIAIGLGFL